MQSTTRNLGAILHFFSSVAHVWVGTWSKNYWADRGKVCFLNQIFSAVRTGLDISQGCKAPMVPSLIGLVPSKIPFTYSICQVHAQLKWP
jgi:hypothetical protein